jgi:hypothetical protein
MYQVFVLSTWIFQKDLARVLPTHRLQNKIATRKNIQQAGFPDGHPL